MGLIQKSKVTLKLLSGTFNFVLILMDCVDKGVSVSPDIRLHVPSASLAAAMETTSPGGEWAAAPETNLQLAPETS